MAAYEQVGEFTAQRIGNVVAKQGGNVASYFLTPDRKVLDAIAGPASAQQLLDEATWTLDHWSQARGVSDEERNRIFRTAHHDQALKLAPPETVNPPPKPAPAGKVKQVKVYSFAPKAIHAKVQSSQPARIVSLLESAPYRIHKLLDQELLPPLADVYTEIFENILREKVVVEDDALAFAHEGLEKAKREGLPMLIVVHPERDNDAYLPTWKALHQKYASNVPLFELAVKQCVVILVPKSKMARLSQALQQPPYTTNARYAFQAQITITDSVGKELANIADLRDFAQVSLPIARALADEIQRQPARPTSQLNSAAELIRAADQQLASEILPLLARQIELNRKKPKSPKS